MNVRKTEVVAYIDPAGALHVALVTAVNILNEGLVSLVYVDEKAPESDNLVRKFDVPHISHPSRQENNPDLPNFIVNAWMDEYEDVLGLPKDHPHFDHPFESKVRNTLGHIVDKQRPVTAALVEAHQVQLSAEDATELQALSGSGGMVPGPVEPVHEIKIPHVAGMEKSEQNIQSIAATVEAGKGVVTTDATVSTDPVMIDPPTVDQPPTTVTTSDPAPTDIPDDRQQANSGT